MQMPHKSTTPRAAEGERKAPVTVDLYQRHVAFLDSVILAARLKHRVLISRSEILAMLIEAFAEGDLDLAEAHSSLGITELVLARRKKRK